MLKLPSEFERAKAEFSEFIQEGRYPIYFDEMYANTWDRRQKAFMIGGIYDYLIKSGHLKLPPYDECTLEHLIAIFIGDKKALYTSECNILSL
jgi:hypothetical protein